MSASSKPNMPPLPQDWVEVPFAELGTQNLVPGNVVTGISAFRDFNKVEVEICRGLKSDLRSIWAGADPVEDENSVARSRVADHLRPDGFQGSLGGGQAVILPFNVTRMYPQKDYRGQANHESEITEGRITNKTPGLGVVFMGPLHSSRPGLEGAYILREVTYCRRTPRVPKSTSYIHGYLWRTFGPKTIVGREHILASQQASISEAQRIASLALRHVILAGHPGHGKRQ